MKNKIINPNLNTNKVITCDHLKIVFGKKKNNFTLIEDFNYQFEKGKIYFIIGNSGVGKTSLISHFNGLIKSKYGNIFVNDQEILSTKRKVRNFKKIRKDLSIVFQFPEYQLFKETVEKDIAFGPINFGVKKEDAYKLAKKYLNQVGLDESYLQLSPFELSGGEKRRVAIAGILAIEPKIIIFDEPTAGLDPFGEKQMLKIITNLKKQGKTVIVVTHNMDNVLEYGDEVILLHDKKILASGKPYDVYLNSYAIKQTKMCLPKVIETINKLSAVNTKFKKLYLIQPNNINSLAKAIASILSEKGGNN